MANNTDPRPEPLEKEKLRMAEARRRWADRTPPVQVQFPANGDRRVEAGLRHPTLVAKTDLL